MSLGEPAPATDDDRPLAARQDEAIRFLHVDLVRRRSPTSPFAPAVSPVCHPGHRGQAP